MIFQIKTPKQAEEILRSMAATKAEGTVIFDIAEGVDPYEIPMIIRKCDQGHELEYVGWNIWGKHFEKRSTYCIHCGYAMRTMAQITIAIQGGEVLQTSYRTEGTKLNL